MKLAFTTHAIPLYITMVMLLVDSVEVEGSAILALSTRQEGYTNHGGRDSPLES